MHSEASRAYFSTPSRIDARREGVLKYALRRTRLGFTVIEALIIAAMLVVVAVLMMPQFSSARDQDQGPTRQTQLREALSRLRTQITIYQAQHSKPPEDIARQLTGPTNEAGELAPLPSEEYRFGPYLRELPENPFNRLRTVRVVGPGDVSINPGAGTHGWVYQPATGDIAADTPGKDARGIAYSQY